MKRKNNNKKKKRKKSLFGGKRLSLFGNRKIISNKIYMTNCCKLYTSFKRFILCIVRAAVFFFFYFGLTFADMILGTRAEFISKVVEANRKQCTF